MESISKAYWFSLFSVLLHLNVFLISIHMHFKLVLGCVISPVKSIAVSSAIQSLSREIHCLASPFWFAHLSFWCLRVKEYVLYGENTLPYRKKNVLHGENPKNGQFRNVLRLFSNTVIQG